MLKIHFFWLNGVAFLITPILVSALGPSAFWDLLFCLFIYEFFCIGFGTFFSDSPVKQKKKTQKKVRISLDIPSQFQVRKHGEYINDILAVLGVEDAFLSDRTTLEIMGLNKNAKKDIEETFKIDVQENEPICEIARKIREKNEHPAL